MEWTDPKYRPMVESIRRRQADTPRVRCVRCKGRGMVFLSDAAGGTETTCLPCGGDGTCPAPFRGFVMA